MLELSSEWARQNDFGWQSIREFPRLNGVARNASVGTIIDTGHVEQLTRREIIQFSASDESSVRYPIDNATVIISVLFAFDLDGDSLSAGQVSFQTFNQQNRIKANRPFTGAIQVSYYTTYRLLAYQPEGGVEIGLMGDGYWRNFGTVISVKDQNSAILEIDPQGIDQADFTLRKELYRVTSSVIVNEGGPWEKHPTFDSGGSWTEPGAPVDGDSLQIYDRPHEIGYLIRGSGRVDYQTTTVFTEQGPGDTGFKARLTLRFHDGNEYTNTPWEDAYSRINISTITADITARFADYTFE